MKAEGVLETRRTPTGGSALETLRASAPLALRPTPDGVFVVSAAAAPLDGDEISLHVDVAPHTELTVRTVAATMAWPSRVDRPSRFKVFANVGAGATLRWLPEQLVPIAGCRHEMSCEVELAGGASVVWREELVLGRSSEPPGDLCASLDVVSEGVPLLRQQLVVGPGTAGFNGPAVVGPARAVGSVFVAGALAPAEAPSEPILLPTGERAVLPLESGGWQITAVTGTAPRLRALLDEATQALLASALATAPDPAIPADPAVTGR